MQLRPQGLYVRALYLEDGTKVQNYVTTDPPPEVGELVAANDRGAASEFEVLNVRYEAVNGFNIVILTVRPAAD